MRGLDWEALTRPTPSRGRSLRNLTVNVFHPFELLPAAWHERAFPWEPELDGKRELLLESAPALVAYGERVLGDWSDFVLEHADELGRRDPPVASPRGEVRFSALLDSQLRHAAFHRDELTAFLG